MNLSSPSSTTPTSLVGVLSAGYDNHGVILDVLQMAKEIAMAQHEKDLDDVLNAVSEDDRSAAFERLLKASDAVYNANQAMENVLASQRSLLRATVTMVEPGNDEAEVVKLGEQSASQLNVASGHIDSMASDMDGPHMDRTYERYVAGVGWNVKEAPLSNFIGGLRAVAAAARQRAQSLVERIRGIQAHMGSRVISRVAIGRKAIADLYATIGRKARGAKDTAQERARGVLQNIHNAAAAAQQMADKAVETTFNGVADGLDVMGAVVERGLASADKVVEKIHNGVVDRIDAVTDAAQRAAQTVGEHAAATAAVAGDIKNAVKANYSGHLSRLRESLGTAPGAPTQSPAAPAEPLPKVTRAEVLVKLGFKMSVAPDPKLGDTFPHATWVVKDLFGMEKTASFVALDSAKAAQDAQAAAWKELVGQAGFLKFIDTKQLTPEDEAALVNDAFAEVVAMKEAEAQAAGHGNEHADSHEARERARG